MTIIQYGQSIISSFIKKKKHGLSERELLCNFRFAPYDSTRSDWKGSDLGNYDLQGTVRTSVYENRYNPHSSDREQRRKKQSLHS